MVLGKVWIQRGAGSFGCLLLVAIIAAGGYAGYQLAMPRIRNSSFEDRINESLTNLRQMSAADVQKQIIQFGADFDIALTPAQVKVDTSGNRLRLDVSYEKLVDLKVWQKTEVFHLQRNPAP